MMQGSITASLLVSLLGFMLGGCSEAPPAPPAPPDMVALYKADDLKRATALLSSSGCIAPGAEAALLDSAPPSGSRDTEAFVSAVEQGRGVCDGGRAFLTRLAQSPILALFEWGRIVVDTDRDSCHDSVFELETNELISYDADGNGCLDRMYAIESLASFAELPPEVQTELVGGVVEVLQRMLPPSAELLETPGFDPVAYRAEAVPRLLELIEWVGSAPEFPGELVPLYTAFLSNNLPLAEEWTACSAMPTAPEPNPGGESAVGTPLRFYVYTSTAPHGWKSLAVGDKEWARGLYPESAGTQYPAAAPDIPDADSARTATPTPAPAGPGSPSSSQNPSGGASWGAELGGEDQSSTTASSNSTIGSVYGLFKYYDGVIRDEGSREDWTSRICWEVTEEEWNLLAEHMNGETEEPPDWNLGNHNCLSWAANNAALIGRRLPPYTTVGIPNPARLDASLQEIGHGGTFEGGTVTLPGR